MLQAKTRRRYPSGLKLQYATGCLDRSAIRSISRSTRQRWKTLTAAGFYLLSGIDVIDSDSTALMSALIKNKRLKLLLLAAIGLILIYRQLLRTLTLTPEHISVLIRLLTRLLDYATEKDFKQQLLRCLPFSVHQWAAWNSRKICKASLVNLCRRKHPFQLASAEVAVIKEATADNDYKHWPLSSIYYQLMRDGKLHCSLSTFYKYYRLLGVTRPRHTGKNKREPLKAAGPMKMLHMDVTLFKTADGVKHYRYVIRDNYSRALLACKAALSYSSQIAKETLQGVLEKHGLLEKEGELITDGGPENKGAVTDWLGKPGMLWKKLVAQLDITQSNSMVEAINRIIKHRYLYRHVIANTEKLQKLLPGIIADYNEMPLACLYGLTPNEVLAGNVPDKERWKGKIAAARKERLAVNQQFACVDSC